MLKLLKKIIAFLKKVFKKKTKSIPVSPTFHKRNKQYNDPKYHQKRHRSDKHSRRVLRAAFCEEMRSVKIKRQAGQATQGRSKVKGMKKKFIWRLKEANRASQEKSCQENS